MRALLGVLDAAVRYLVPIATVLALSAAAVLVLPVTLVYMAASAEDVPAVTHDAIHGTPNPTVIAPDGQHDDHGVTEARPGSDALATVLPAEVEPLLPLLAPLPPRVPAAAAPTRPRPSAELPILMYHYTGPLPRNSDAIRRDLTVSPENLERQLAHFREHGIQTVHLDQLLDHLAGRAELPPRAVVLTFDDGYADNYEYAFPLLKQYGMVGTFFVTTDLIGRPGYMTWAQLEEMALWGMSIQGHSVSHANLTTISRPRLTRELVESKRALEERLGQPVRFLAYPAGKYNRAVIVATREAGYEAAVTVNHGTVQTADGPYELVRVRARGADTVEQLVARMTPRSWHAANR